MDENGLIIFEKDSIADWDFDTYTAKLDQALSVYDSVIYTDESMKTAKDDRAQLKKYKTEIENKKKEYRKECLAPYEALEPRIRELTALLDGRIERIDAAVKEYEERTKAQKEKQIRAYYDKNAALLGSLADKLFEKLADPKWMNASTTKSRYESEIQARIGAAIRDISAVRAMNSPYFDTLIELYAETASLDAVREKDAELRSAVEQAGIVGKSVPVTDEQTVQKTQEPEDGDVTLLAIKASAQQLARVKDFMRALGIEFEVR